MQEASTAELVPPQFVHLANAVKRCPKDWHDEDPIQNLELEANGTAKKLKAERFLVDKFLAGELDKNNDPTRRVTTSTAS